MSDTQTYEYHLSCGDSQSSRVEPRIGVRRMCKHCETWQTVIGVGTPVMTAIADDTESLRRLREMMTGQPEPQMTQSAMFGYAHDAGMYRESLVIVRRQLRTLLDLPVSQLYGSERIRLRDALETIDDALSSARIVYTSDPAEGISPNFDDDPS